MIDTYCAYALVAGARPRTILVRARVLRLFDSRHGLLTATRADVLTFLARDICTQTRASYLLHLRAFYRWAVEEEILATDPTVRVPLAKVPRGQPRPISDAALTLALTTAHEPLRSWFILAAFAGLRACEIAPLQGSDLRDGMLFLRETKGGGSRMVVASAVVRTCVLSQGTDGPLWDVTAERVSARTNDWLRRRGIVSTFHAVRHWSGTSMLRAADGNVRIVQEFLGHTNLNSTMVYTLVTADQVRVAAERLSAA